MKHIDDLYAHIRILIEKSKTCYITIIKIEHHKFMSNEIKLHIESDEYILTVDEYELLVNILCSTGYRVNSIPRINKNISFFDKLCNFLSEKKHFYFNISKIIE